MSDYLTRGFRAQLTTSMDSVLKRAVFEIMMIFENSLHDHQMELAQKGEEIAHLKIKLQRAEVRLKDGECGGNGGVETNKTVITETRKEPEMQKQPEDALNAPGQTSDIPEIDFEVPDDWCAPLGCETVTRKQEENVCPSVRLRKLSIPLWPLPIIKQEVRINDFESQQKTKGPRRSRRCSSLNKMQDRTTPTRRPPMRNDMKKLLQDIKREYIDLTGGTVRGKRGRPPAAAGGGGGQENTAKKNKTETVKQCDENRFNCKYCKKVFDTEFGLSVHVRSHKKCRGCKKEFPFPSALKQHKQRCRKLKMLLAKKSTNLPKPEPPDERNPTAPSKTPVIVKKESTPSASNHSDSSTATDRSIKKHSCVHCSKMFHKRSKMKEHARIHTGERPFACSLCPKKFRLKQSLKLHTSRIHKDKTKSCETNGNFAWTQPLEETGDSQEDLMSPKKGIHSDESDGSPDTKPSERWQTMGARSANGFICLLCQKVSGSKIQLIEHIRTHTGEKPIRCANCPAKFRFRGQLSMHKKKCGPLMKAVQCPKCGKKFPSKASYKQHVPMCQKDLPHVCNVCGKGFFYNKRLRNHMERFHKK